jgi:hypothetical protein
MLTTLNTLYQGIFAQISSIIAFNGRHGRKSRPRRPPILLEL